MEEIGRVVRSAANRLLFTSFLRELMVLATAAVIGLFVAVFVQRLFGLTWPWQTIFISTGGAVLLGAILVSVIKRKDSLGVARELDDRAGLRESLSTAMCVSKEEDPWSKAVVETARQRAVSVKVRDAVPIEAPRLWPVTVAAAGALVLAWLVVPNWDILKILAKKDEIQKQQQELVAAKTDVEQRTQKLEALLEKAKVQLKDEKPDEATDQAKKAEELKNPEEVRRAAVKRISEVADRLSQMKDSEKAQQMEALKDQLRQLRQSTDGPLNEFERQLARGNFDNAKKELEDLAKKMSEGSMSKEDAAKAKAQLENLSKQLDKIAADKKELQNSLEKQGLTKEQAKELMQKAGAADPKELQKALDQLKQLSPEQKEQLMKQAMAQMKASQQAQKMAEQCKQAGEGMQGNKMNQEGMEGMQGMMGELSDSEQMSQEMDAAMAAMKECNAQLAALSQCLGGNGNCLSEFAGIGQWREGDTNKQGSGSGGPGQGLGPSPEAAPTDYKIAKEKANVNTQDGPIIGSRLVWGEQIRGESHAAFSEAVESSDKAASEALDSMTIPRQYHGAVKSYFGTLKEKADKNAATNSKPADGKAPAQPAKPATDAKDSSGK
ncbi:MAG: hypothetical protein IT435_16960 [Phycisphaerales bacterium]|nr:hypothetical protein [Phycisphaerales bacterium]